MNSYTSARVYIGVPNALTLNQTLLDATYGGIVGANARWTRITLPWNAIQATSSPSYSWAAADLAINRAFAAGLNVQVALTGPLPTGVTTVTPAAFTPFVQAVAQRYKPLGAGIGVPGRFVQEFQVWNEPNVIANWPSAVSPASVSASGYTAVLKAAYGVIKASHPGAVVVMAGLQACNTASSLVNRLTVTTAQEPVTYLTNMYLAGAKGFLDVAAYHPLTLPTAQFPKPPAPSGLTMKRADAFYAALKARDAGRKVYWTAVGFPTSVFSTEQQSAYLDTMRWFAEERKMWLAGFCVHDYSNLAS